MFDSVLKLSILVNLLKNIMFCAKICAKTRKTCCTSCGKDAQKFRIKIFCAKITQILLKKYGHFVKTLILRNSDSESNFAQFQQFQAIPLIFAQQCRLETLVKSLQFSRL